MRGAKPVVLFAVAAALFSTAAQAQDLPGAPAVSDTAASATAISSELAPAGPPPEQVAPGSLPAPEQAAALAAAAPAAEAALSDAELEALGFAVGDKDAPTVDTSLKVFGFGDFGARTLVPRNSEWHPIVGRAGTFAVGNLNLYLSKNLSDRWRTMGEVRFLYLPNAPGNSTLVSDYNDFNHPIKWGGVRIERVYLEWAAHRLLSVRAGQFLTPVGIWNVDHGSPTIISVQKPHVVGANGIPTNQTGLEAFGRWDVGFADVIGYHLTLSNGQGSAVEYQDLDRNKAVGGRLYWETNRLGYFRLGASGYYGKLTNSHDTTAFSAGKLTFPQIVELQYANLSFAADVLWKWEGLHVQSEFFTTQVHYTKAGRTAVANTGAPETAFPSDQISVGGYLLAGYRTPWWGIMPYMVVDIERQRDPANLSAIRSRGVQFGINMRVIDPLVLKVEYSLGKFKDPVPFTRQPLQFVQVQVAWAF
jgi:hypothetical protein